MAMCPGETTLTDLLAGVLPEEQRARVLTHVEACTDCQRVLAAGGGDSILSGVEACATAASAPLERGATLSRYVVLERIGAGAMGVVYAAYDPELDRQVALKVLHPEGRQVEELRLRLVLEAQALARLSDTHVVGVHDVGRHGDAVFLAMELVDGTTLAEWLKQPRSWQEVLRVFREAGQGLAAAHAAGLVHRDFKPTNVLVGRDGRARVTDFGMARPLNRAGPTASRSAREPGPTPTSPLSSPLTRTGMLLGTPAYMAPELVEGRRADALSDQFSFCVALHEALYRVRPFAGDSLEAVTRAALEGRVRPAGRDTKVPAWVRRAVVRGLQPRPEDRFPSMEGLLAALTPPPRRTWARVAVLATAASALGAVVAYGMAHRSEARCEQEAERLGVAWGSTQRERVRAAFLATGAPYASVAWEKVSATLDAHASRWRELRVEACLKGHSTPTSAAWQTTACLDSRLWQLAAVTDVLAHADGQTVRNAQQLTASLEGLASCIDAPALSTRPQPPDALKPRVDAARRALSEAQAQLAAARFTEGIQRTSALLEEIKGLDYRPLEAEVLLVHGQLHAQGDKAKEAEDILYRALWAAEAGRDDETVARTWNFLLWVVGDLLSRPADAERIVRHAEAAVQRLGRERFPAIAADLHHRLTMVRLQQGRYTEADEEARRGLELARRTHGADSLRTADFIYNLARVRYRLRRYSESAELHRQALELRERHLGVDHPELVSSINGLAIVLEELGRTEEALAGFRRSIALHDSSGTPEHRSLAVPLSNLGAWYRTQGRLREAREHFERAYAIFERAYGPDHPSTAVTLANLARLSGDEDRIEEALAQLQDALERFQRSLGPDSPRSATALLYRAYVHERVGHYSEARRDLLRVQAILEKAHGPGKGNSVIPLSPLAALALRAGAPREALGYCQRALEFNERADGPDSMESARSQTCVAEAYVALRLPEKAVPLAERARERLASSISERMDTAWATFVLARALMALQPPERERALVLGQEARSRYEALGIRARPELEQVRAWLRREGVR
ncbi:serine/threonine-protein kinase [Pyxidicoccus xibeiensis]|uniref:serine/threonine-protein kinase n=1 Tax=Pyxidicoccus xibeiensis TaxID=2906759 RepID=UPI0020A76847|nr:serine/threonine-protein kinase [Pyxidicoccus xibeiensis]MCP3135955.1 serine/threonine-protein kinase [Pyxidicoccus xibeiensis]